MRLNEFSHKVEFKIQDFGEGSFRINIISDLKIDRSALPDLFKKIMKLPNQIGLIDIGGGVRWQTEYPDVETVFLAAEARRQGLGKMVYSKALEYAKEHYNAKGISSHPRDRNMNSDAFWDKFSQGSVDGRDVRRDPFEGLEEVIR